MERWRSLLFVPGDDERRIAKAGSLGADAVIIDLEDGVAPASKQVARTFLPTAAADVGRMGAAVIVRINGGSSDLAADLDAAITPAVQALMVPKTERADSLRDLSNSVSVLEAERGLEAGTIKLIALIESPAALPHLYDIAAVERVTALALGTEDFSLAMGVAPTAAVLDLPCRQVALASATRTLMAFAVPVSIAAFRDTEAMRASAATARAFGASGMLCVHPNQVGIANEIFSPSPAELGEAEALLSAWDNQGRGEAGVITFNGKMIDKPVVDRARRLLQRS